MYKLNLDDFNKAYYIFEDSFPKQELRPYDKMKHLFLDNELSFYGVRKDKELVSAIIVWEFDDFIFLENFATAIEYRGLGIGEQLLKEICSVFNKRIILEVEEPYDKLSERRVAFYERNGFVKSDFGYQQPPFYEEGETYYLKMMSYKSNLDKDTFDKMKRIIFKNVYKKSLF